MLLREAIDPLEQELQMVVSQWEMVKSPQAGVESNPASQRATNALLSTVLFLQTPPRSVLIILLDSFNC